MQVSIKDTYEDYKKYRNIIVYHDEILLFFPYMEHLIKLKEKHFISKEKIDELFEKGYKDSEFYKYLKELAVDENTIYETMKENKDIKYACLKQMYDALLNVCINLCNLIYYIGNYPSTWPVPKENEKNKELENLLEKYDIIVRYSAHDDIDKMYLVSDDVVRIIETLKERLNTLDKMDKKQETDEWIFTRKKSKDDLIEGVDIFIDRINSFPLSEYQKRGKSRVEEGKHYLRMQHGDDII